jgi:hypothetical protein
MQIEALKAREAVKDRPRQAVQFISLQTKLLKAGEAAENRLRQANQHIAGQMQVR